MNFDPNEPMPAEETRCAACGEEVDEHFPHARFVLAYGRRRGRFHPACVPAEGLDAWTQAAGDRLLRGSSETNASPSGQKEPG